MEKSRILEHQKNLQKAFLGVLNSTNKKEGIQHLGVFRENARALIAISSSKDADSDDVSHGANDNVLTMARMVVSGMTKMKKADLAKAHITQHLCSVIQILLLLETIPMDNPEKYEVIVIGVSHLWRLLFCKSDDCMDTTPEALSKRSSQLTDLLDLVSSAYLDQTTTKSSVQLSYIMLEIFRHTDVNNHIEKILVTMTTVPKCENPLKIYPGLVSRIVVNLSKMRESDFARAMKVLESWIQEVIIRKFTRAPCKDDMKETMDTMIKKTGEAVHHIFEKYWKRYWTHMTGLCTIAVNFKFFEDKTIRLLQTSMIQLLRDKDSRPALQKVMREASEHTKLGLWKEVSTFIAGQSPDALQIYLGYVDLRSQVRELPPLDEYITSELVFKLAETPVIEDVSSSVKFSTLALSEDVAPDLLDQFSTKDASFFMKVASIHMDTLAPDAQKQCVSKLIHKISSLDEEDDATLGTMLTLLHAFLATGAESLESLASDILDLITIKVIAAGIVDDVIDLCTVSALAALFGMYDADITHMQVCNILFWSLGLCVAGNETTINQAKSLVSNINEHQMRQGFYSSDLGTKPLLCYYKNLLVSRCIKELREEGDGSEPVSKVLYMLLIYNEIEVKDMFDIALQLEHGKGSEIDIGYMPDLHLPPPLNPGAKLYTMYCYAFIARQVDVRYNEYDSPGERTLKNVLPYDEELKGIRREGLVEGKENSTKNDTEEVQEPAIEIAKEIVNEVAGEVADNVATEAKVANEDETAPEDLKEAKDAREAENEELNNVAEEKPEDPACIGEATDEASEDASTDSQSHETLMFLQKASMELDIPHDKRDDPCFKDARMATATVVATRCRYHLNDANSEVKSVALQAIHRCFRAFSHDVEVLRVRLYEVWDPLFVCMEDNIRNLRLLTPLFGILTIAVRFAYDFVEKWLLQIFDKLTDLIIDECKKTNVTNADEANGTMRFKFSVAFLHFVLPISSAVINRKLYSKILAIALVMCRSTACTVEILVTRILRNLFYKNPPLIRNVLLRAGSNDPASVALVKFAVKRDLTNLVPKGARLRSLLPRVHNV